MLVSSIVGSLVISMVTMSLLWLVYIKKDNPSVVDIGFGANVVLNIMWYIYLFGVNSLYHLFLILPGVIWAVRLAWYLGKRNLSGHLDGRYVDIKKRWSHRNLKVTFFFFFQFQALLDVILSLPFLWVLYSKPDISILSIVAASIAYLAILGESIADAQLKKFKSDSSNKGKVCAQGLWKFSRHPNYFFELLFWVAIAVSVSSIPWGFVAWVNPIMMAHFLLNVTGIPETEAQNIRTKGSEYEQYIRVTSMLIPLPPKKS